MKILLDTNALIWWMDDEPMLGREARQLIANPAHIVLSTMVSLWEITMKWRVGKFPQPASVYYEQLREEGIDLVDICWAHVEALNGIDMHHKDPFDHLILAQAKVEQAMVITSDREMSLYGVKCFPAGR